MNLTFFDSKQYDIKSFNKFSQNHNFKFVAECINNDNIYQAKGSEICCCFVNDDLNSDIISTLSELGCKMIAMRCAGFDKVDIDAAKKHNIIVTRVPLYSPNSVAEHAFTLLMAINRNISESYKRVISNNYNIEGLESVMITGKTIGVIGTGKIGQAFIELLKGFNTNIIAYDLFKNENIAKVLNFKYVDSLDEIYHNSDFIVLGVPLTNENKYMINKETISKMKDGVVIINCSRGKLINTRDLIDAVKSKKIRGAGLDVYENESGIFFRDFSNKEIDDSLLKELSNTNNIILTAHQSFLTMEALNNIAQTVIENVEEYFINLKLINSI